MICEHNTFAISIMLNRVSRFTHTLIDDRKMMNAMFDSKARVATLACLLVSLTSGCSVVNTTANVVGSVASTAVSVAGTAASVAATTAATAANATITVGAAATSTAINVGGKVANKLIDAASAPAPVVVPNITPAVTVAPAVTAAQAAPVLAPAVITPTPLPPTQ